MQFFLKHEENSILSANAESAIGLHYILFYTQIIKTKKLTIYLSRDNKQIEPSKFELLLSFYHKIMNLA